MLIYVLQISRQTVSDVNIKDKGQPRAQPKLLARVDRPAVCFLEVLCIDTVTGLPISGFRSMDWTKTYKSTPPPSGQSARSSEARYVDIVV